MEVLMNKKIGFIGAGKVGITLGAYFKNKGLNLVGYFSRNNDSSYQAANLLAVKQYNNLPELIVNCNIIIIATPDDQISVVWNQIKENNIAGMIIAHTSGSMNSNVFDEISSLGAYGYSIHPMYAFSDRNGCFKDLANIVFTIEGDSTHIDSINNIITSLGNRVLVIEPEKKALYHLANVMASNLVLALLKISNDCMIQCGIDQDITIDALLPLIMNNIENIRNKGFHNALTGPIERNDVGTIAKHLAVLPTDYEIIYKSLSSVLLELAIEKHDQRDYSALEVLLNDIK